MRRAALAAMLTAAMAFTGACSASPFGSDERRNTLPPASAPAGPVASNQQFDRPFAVAGESWDATVTLSNLRIVPSSYYTDTVLALDVRAVQSAGEPTINPSDIIAYSPSGDPLERIESPSGLVSDPLVPSVLTYPGEEITGTIAWKMPSNGRIGRIEMSSPRTLASITVTLQPVDPSAQPKDSSAS